MGNYTLVAGTVPQKGLNLTHYGGIWDPQKDTDSLLGKGAFSPRPHSLVPGTSVAILAADAKRWGLKHNEYFNYQGRQFRYDDEIPWHWQDESGKWHIMSPNRIDIYDPANQEQKLGVTSSSKAGGDIHIHYTVTNHIHGGEDLAHKMASISFSAYG